MPFRMRPEQHRRQDHQYMTAPAMRRWSAGRMASSRRLRALTRTKSAKGLGSRHPESQQRDYGQRRIGNGSFRAQQRDEHGNREKSRHGQGQPHRKGRRMPKLVQRCSPRPVHARCPSRQHRTHSAKVNAKLSGPACRKRFWDLLADGRTEPVHFVTYGLRRRLADFPWPPARKLRWNS